MAPHADEKGTKVINGHRTLAVLLAVAGSALFSASPALAHRGRLFGLSFGEPGTGAGQLSLTSFYISAAESEFPIGGSGLAVDETTHDVYVADTGNNRVDEFTSAGAFVRAWGWGVVNGASELQVCTEASGCRAGLPGTSPGEFERPAFVAIDDSPSGEGAIYVANYNHYGEGQEELRGRIVQKFTAQGALVESWGSKGRVDDASLPAPDRFGIISGVGVGPSGELVVGSAEGVYEFSQSSGTLIAPRIGGPKVSTSWPDGFAVDGVGNFYYYNGKQIQKYSPDGVLEGVVFEALTPDPPRYTFAGSGLAVAKSGELYVDERNAIQVISPSCVSLCAPATTFSSPLLTGGAGLAVDSRRETVYIAETASNKIESIVPEPPAAPLVEAGSETVSGVSGDSATLEAVISPRSETSEEPGSYHFQYTSEESFQREGFAGAGSTPVPDGQLAPSFEGELVTAHVQGLQPGTVYRYRVVAENAISRKEGKPTEGERNEAGEEIARTFTTQTSGVFSLPDGRVWELVSPPNKHGALIEALGTGVVQASATGYAFTYLATVPATAAPEGNSNGTQVLSMRGAAGASSWGARDIATPREFPNGFNLSGGPEYQFFSADLSLSIVDPFGAFDPAISAEASEQTPFLRTDFPSGNPGDPCSGACYRPLVTGVPGFADVPEGTDFGNGQCHTDGQTQCGPSFAGATPDASHIVLSSGAALVEGAPAGAASLYEWAAGQLQLVSVLPDGEPSPQGGKLGSKSFRAAEGIHRNQISSDGSRVVWTAGKSLYLRDTVSEETVQLSNASAEFQDASSDDTRVFFTVAGDLYMFEAPTGAALSAGHTTNLTPAGGVLGPVMGVSRDGSSVYFVAESVLSGGEANGQGETAFARQPNLYLDSEGSIRLVAVLSREDRGDWIEQGVGFPFIEKLAARVSPDGRWLAFMSERSLTGYDNRDSLSGRHDEEVFLYDAAAGGGRGGLVCASCDPTGARPHGRLIVSQILAKSLVDGQEIWAGHWLAGNVPGWISPMYQARYLSDGGRLFFDSSDALVPADTNGTEDVYEYEPPGTGDCTSASATFSAHSGGCADLVSSGAAKEESAFMDASESGDDVFFLTSAQLSKRDTDSVPDVYDARVDGGFPEPQAPPACEGDACQSPVAAPNDPTPGSLTYRGPGNPVPLLASGKATKKKALKCTKGKKLSHGKCVKVQKRAGKAKRSTKKTGRAGNGRGARS